LTKKERQKQADSTNKHLTVEQGKLLVKLARQAITEYITNHLIIKPPSDMSDELRRRTGAFVTLNSIKPIHELRGCIGFPYPEQPLIDAVLRGAIYAATEDPRFEPLSLEELKNSVVVEVTVLTPPRVLKPRVRKELPELIEVGRHGLIVEDKGTSGLLLPQVATEWKWDASEFLMNCCLKAGLPPDSWLLDGVEVKVFEGEIFEETEPQGEIRRKPIGEA
jgi:uncharacterized protein (TIGR00296 family)